MKEVSAITADTSKKQQCRQTLVNIFTNVNNENKFLNQKKATVLFIEVTEELLELQFSRTTNVDNSQKTKKPRY